MAEKYQHKPVEAGSLEATDDERIAGIIEQVRADASVGHGDPVALLRHRIDESGIQVSDEDFGELAGLVRIV